MKSDNDMKRKLVINSAKDAEIISVRLSPDKTPIAYENKVRMRQMDLWIPPV